jgi:hypothetical protein
MGSQELSLACHLAQFGQHSVARVLGHCDTLMRRSVNIREHTEAMTEAIQVATGNEIDWRRRVYLRLRAVVARINESIVCCFIDRAPVSQSDFLIFGIPGTRPATGERSYHSSSGSSRNTLRTPSLQSALSAVK